MTSTISLQPLHELTVERHQIPAWQRFPNTSIQGRPVLVYRACVQPRPDVDAAAIEAHLRAMGMAEPTGRFPMRPEDHFHSNTHEVLCIFRGRARLCFGHVDNPARVVTTVVPGDAVVIPAGVAHRLLDDLTGDFEMVGAYPDGVAYDWCVGAADEADKVRGIAELPWFSRDPIYGTVDGPALIGFDGMK